MTISDYKKIASTIPKTPGVYQFISNNNILLYIGKAKDLKKRISSYFSSRKDMTSRIKQMVLKASKIEYTLVNTEQDALLLEATLIKRYQPKYNIALKKGKPYLYICVKNEDFSRVFITNNVMKDGSLYYGPYSSKFRANQIIKLINSIFKLRTCNLDLSEKNIINKKYNYCLEYQIKNCNAPCVGYEQLFEYDQKILQIKNILNGKFSKVKFFLNKKIQYCVNKLAFEEAHTLNLQLKALDDYQSKSVVVNPKIGDIDVFSVKTIVQIVYVNYLKIIDGAIVNSFNAEFNINLDSPQNIYFYIISLIRDKFQSNALELILPFQINHALSNIKITIPQIGDKRKLLELSLKNLEFFIQKQKHSTPSKRLPNAQLLELVKKDLNLPFLPKHIECFDNSNFQGTFPVASMVCFINGIPAKKEYKHYHIKTVKGIDDFASMEEVVFRRYKRLLSENKSLPQLIIIDGGKGQLNAAIKSLKLLKIEHKIKIIGIAKKLEEIFFPNDSIPLLLSKKSQTLKLIQRIRNETHNFAINFHKKIRLNNSLQTELTKIKGIGPISAKKLLKHFGSIKVIKKASLDDLNKVINLSKSKEIFHYFQKFNNDS